MEGATLSLRARNIFEIGDEEWEQYADHVAPSRADDEVRLVADDEIEDWAQPEGVAGLDGGNNDGTGDGRHGPGWRELWLPITSRLVLVAAVLLALTSLVVLSALRSAREARAPQRLEVRSDEDVAQHRRGSGAARLRKTPRSRRPSRSQRAIPADVSRPRLQGHRVVPSRRPTPSPRVASRPVPRPSGSAKQSAPTPPRDPRSGPASPQTEFGFER